MAPDETAADPDSSVSPSMSASASGSIPASASASVPPSASASRSAFVVGTVERVERAISSLGDSKTGDVQTMAASQITILTAYYDAALAHANKSFTSALIAAGLGLYFFMSTLAVLIIFGERLDVAVIGALAGALVEVIAGINFALYGKTTAQLSHFHSKLDQTQRFLLANSICESLNGDVKEAARSELVSVIATLELPEKPTGSET